MDETGSASELPASALELLADWCRQAGAAPGDAHALAAQAWETFRGRGAGTRWDDVARDRTRLRYLRMCVVAVVVDAARTHEAQAQARTAVPGEPSFAAPSGTAMPPGTDPAQMQREQAVIALLFGLGLAPAAVAARHPELFSSAVEVIHTARVLLDRAQREDAAPDA